MFARFTWPLVLIAAVVSLGYAGAQFDVFKPACSEPVTYRIGEFDSRFGVSRAELEDALYDAASLWNVAAGKTLVVFAEDGDVTVNLEYGTEQRTSQLGQVIDADQAAYDAAKADFEAQADALEEAKRDYAAMEASFEARVTQYEKDVEYWNARGGAPPAEYQRLQSRQRELNRDQEKVNAQAAHVNALIDTLNLRVDDLNRLAEAINRRVDTYNSNAHTDFDQGRYIEDENGKRIIVREFTESTELRRLLAHEFGHALGLDHVENPDSLMYSYNVGSRLALTEEDMAEFTEVCDLDK